MKRKPANPRSPSPLDAVIGKHIRKTRLAKGVSQERLAEIIGVTFQQVQKNEKGVNRMSAARLYHVAKALDEPIANFFGD